MEYQLEIYRPGTCDSDGCIKTFTATASFLSIRVGDLLNTKTWEKPVESQAAIFSQPPNPEASISN